MDIGNRFSEIRFQKKTQPDARPAGANSVADVSAHLLDCGEEKKICSSRSSIKKNPGKTARGCLHVRRQPAYCSGRLAIQLTLNSSLRDGVWGEAP
ncbi:MAG: hypothetical protein WA970_10800, partial [Gammaproteobacteria bacterium]